MDISMPIFWLILAVVLSVIEIITMGLTTIWFAAGAVVALILSFFATPIPLQVAVFLIVSIVVLVLVRPMAGRYFNNRTAKTNIDAYVGRKLIVKTEIDNIRNTGKIDMDGSTWLASAVRDDDIIHEGEEVVVRQVRGARLIVEREEK